MKPKGFKIGDRVKLRGTQHKGTVRSVNIPGYYVLLDKGTTAWHKESSLIRLVKKKKQPAITKQQLAAAWNRFVWGNNHHTHASESVLFKAFCKELGV